jgi:Na+-translocating ferredoxin:NAD+ oxidoreductase RNF subunit RnfB
MNVILITAIFAAILAFVLGILLGFFQKFFFVAKDPLTDRIREALPGANCGGCGFPGCDGYAAAVAGGSAKTNRCAPGGETTAEKLSAIMGVTESLVPVFTVVACQGSKDHAPQKGDYAGVQSCRGAKLSAGGTKLCAWGCLGFGDCAAVCKFGGITMGDDGLPHIDYTKCTGCKLCAAECPQQIIREIPKSAKGAIALCSNRNPVKPMIRKTCTAGCIKCELCVKNCPAQSITMTNGIPVVDYTKCTSCGTCVAKCPSNVLKILEFA